MNETDFFRYEDICYGVLASLKITHRTQDYQDYLQIARLSLLQTLTTKTLPTVETQEDYLFRGFLFQYIRWQVIDALRKQQTRLVLPLTDDFDTYLIADDLTKTVLDHCLVATLKPLLNTEEWAYLNYLLKDMTTTAIAKKLKLSRQALYKRRKSIQKKIFFLLLG